MVTRRLVAAGAVLFAAATNLVVLLGLRVSGQKTPGKPLLDKAEVTKRQRDYLESRYDLSGKTDPLLVMSGGRKHVPVGPTSRLPEGVHWEEIGNMTAEEVRSKRLFPYPPLWHPLQEPGGMVFPPAETRVVDGLERADVAFDLPEAYLPELPPPLFLTTHGLAT